MSTTQAESLRKMIKELLGQGVGKKSKHCSWAVVVFKCVSWWLGMKIKMGSNFVTGIREANVYWGLGMKMVCQISWSASRFGSISTTLWVLHGGVWAHFPNSGWQSSLQEGARQIIKIFTAHFFSSHSSFNNPSIHSLIYKSSYLSLSIQVSFLLFFICLWALWVK